MNFTNMKPGLISLTTAFGASLCCVAPMTVVFLGLGSGAFMMTTMQFRPVLYPLGLLGLALSYYMYFRRKRVCDAASCKMQGKPLNLTLLSLSTLLMGAVTYVDFFLVSM